MCGIVGVAGNLFEKDARSFKDLLYMDTLRGDHSTGVLTISNTMKTYDVLKRPGPAIYLMESKGFDKNVNSSARVLLGHNRYGTMGKPTTANAHPFDFDNVCGVHNGTLPYNVKSKFEDHGNFETDSEAFYNHVNEHGIEKAVELISQGAYCFVWWDKDTDELCMLRNDERPMWYVFSADRTVMYWASEGGMLIAALSRNDVKAGDIQRLEPHKLHRWKIPLGNSVWPQATVTDLRPKKEEPVYHGGNFRPIWERQAEQKAAQTRTQEATAARAAQPGAVKIREPTEDEKFIWSTLEVHELHIDDVTEEGWHSNESLVDWFKRRFPVITLPSQRKVVDLPTRKVLGYINPKTRAEITKAEFEVITKHGCDWCQRTVEWGDAVQLCCVDGDNIECICDECVEKDVSAKQYLEG